MLLIRCTTDIREHTGTAQDLKTDRRGTLILYRRGTTCIRGHTDIAQMFYRHCTSGKKKKVD